MNEHVHIHKPRREQDISAYGNCWCGEPRRGEIIDDPHHPGGELSRLICYAGHTGMEPT